MKKSRVWSAPERSDGVFAQAVREFNNDSVGHISSTSGSTAGGKSLHVERREEEDDEVSEEEKEVCVTSEILEPSLRVLMLTHAAAKSRTMLLEDTRPDYIIMYDADIQLIREVEVYGASVMSSQPSPKVYFLIYEGSVEEHRYVSALAREKRAFENLIETKSRLVITPIDLDPCDSVDKSESQDSRRGRPVISDSTPSLVLVDIREFRSILPSLLHRAQMKLHPVTLTVGDFILSPEICVERKGISDLFQSFASGRLYNQAEMMSKHYKFPCLLIEFSEDKSFCLQSISDITPDIQVNNITSKIALLVLAFSRLRILWSRSPHMTVEIFRTLKTNFSEPDVSKAMAIGSDSGPVDDEDSACDVAKEILLSLPGINGHNISCILGAVNSIAELSMMSLKQLEKLIGTMNSKKLFYFMAQRFQDE
eukprot:CAMPEP_0182425664 /NCGR_PEP_ID=MMETSP1167-20130531/12140_1 /TAXON_ID=2988 /ORGANISM="Mallomonas Sp, Strain CCMP3275" /LENGTH=423 /DNA_ID=CAMNT_0024606567 /DNA_START=1 /DNA_END=1272 /DNA_ORIENTATION=+